MAILIGKGQIRNLTGVTLAIAGVTGYISPNLQSLRVSHKADAKTTKGQSGTTTAAYYSDEMLECTFDFIPEGTTIANAVSSAQLPPAGSQVVISGLPIIQMGDFIDGLNTTATSGFSPWIYEGGGEFSNPNDDKATMTLPLKRYKGITSATAITA